MIRGIFFDANGVLYDRRESPGRYVAETLAERGYPTELAAAEKARLRDLREQAHVGRVSPDTYWDVYLSAHGVATPDERAALVPRIIEKAHEVVALPGAAPTLAELKRRGFILGIVTDTMYPLEWKVTWLTRIGVAEFVDAITCSTDVGVHKPDPAIYLRALAQAGRGLVPSESAFVGHDSRELEGARRAGMITVAVHHDPDAMADYYARTLPELLRLPIFRPLQD